MMGLTFLEEDDGNWRASFKGYYHAIGFCKEQAVCRLDGFIRAKHPEVLLDFEKARDEFLRPKNNVATAPFQHFPTPLTD
jgi:hypothetical protein